MKKHVIIITCFLLVLGAASAQIRSNRDLLGKWQGNDRGDQLQLEFFADSKVMITAPGGRLPLATYTADFNKMPVEVSLTATDNGKQLSFKGQMEFLDNDSIKFTYFGDSKRRDAFAKGRTIIMKKSK
ncbi:MAG: hypothetical protein ABIN36_16240 [Ferruginibacter sp.]